MKQILIAIVSPVFLDAAAHAEDGQRGWDAIWHGGESHFFSKPEGGSNPMRG